MALRIDVSFTDHLHVIGRGGKNTREVMTRTGCHIHFPDSNKDANGAKSNQLGVFCYLFEYFCYFLECKRYFISRLQLLALITRSKTTRYLLRVCIVLFVCNLFSHLLGIITDGDQI